MDNPSLKDSPPSIDISSKKGPISMYVSSDFLKSSDYLGEIIKTLESSDFTNERCIVSFLSSCLRLSSAYRCTSLSGLRRESHCEGIRTLLQPRMCSRGVCYLRPLRDGFEDARIRSFANQYRSQSRQSSGVRYECDVGRMFYSLAGTRRCDLTHTFLFCRL